MDIRKSDDSLLLSVAVDDTSYRYRTIMGDHNLTIYFSLAEHVEIPVGSYVEYQSQRYTLIRPEALKMQHTRYFEYTIIFESYQACAKRWKFRNPVDGRLKFPLTAKPHEHLQMFVDNMNRRDSGWSVGSCIEGVEHLISYDHAYCFDALQQMASEFETEWEIIGKQVSLKKVEYNKTEPLSLSYGKGNGFKSGIRRENSKDAMPVEILFTQGGTRNIDASKYGNKELLLPRTQSIGFDGVHFEDESGYDSTLARHYITSSDGRSLQRSDKALSSMAEDSLDCSDIYPKRIGTVSQVIVEDAEQHFYDFTDVNSPNYTDYLIEGEKMTVIFQNGMLAGREFEVNYSHDVKDVRGVSKPAHRFEIVPQEIDGITMPDNTFKPAVGNEFVIFHCALPQSYICDNATKSGAEWEMFRKAVKYMYENEEQKFTFTGELDGIWAKKDWVNIGGKILLGGYIRFTDARFQIDPVLVRITAIKDYINKPHSPEITLSNEVVVGGFSTEFKKVKAEEVIIDDNYQKGEQFTKRRFRDAKETMLMLEKALIQGYSEGIAPIAVQTMQLLVGDESLQYRFVNDHTLQNPQIITPTFSYSPTTGKFSINGGYYLQHLTLGIDTIKSSHNVNEYKWWYVQSYESAVLDDQDKHYYLYLKCPTTSGGNAEYILSENAIGMGSVSGYYHFLVGVLNTEYEGERSFASLYGFTEILGGRITTDKIVSTDGNTYFDLAQGEIGGKITFKSGTSGLEQISEWSSFYTTLQSKLDNIQEQLDGVVETWYYEGVPTLNNLPASQWTTTKMKDNHIGDLYYDKLTGKAYRFMNDNGTYKWVLLADNDIATALERASRAQDTADGKRRVFVAQPTNASVYDIGDLWVNATYGSLYTNDILRCISSKLAGATFNINHWEKASKYTDDTKVNGLISNLNNDNVFTIVEKRSIREALKEICNTQTDYIYNTSTRQIVGVGLLKTAYDDCIATDTATSREKASALVTAGNNLFYYLYHTGHVWEDGDSSVPNGFRDSVRNYFASFYNLLEGARKSTIIDGDHIITGLIDTNTLIAKNVYSKDGNFQILADGTIYAKGGVFSGYIQTQFVDKGYNDFTISDNLNVVVSGRQGTQVITLPSSNDFVGKRVIINNNFYPPYTRSVIYGTGMTKIVVANNGYIEGISDLSGSYNMYVKDFTFQAGTVELLCVANGRWVLLSDSNTIIRYTLNNGLIQRKSTIAKLLAIGYVNQDGYFQKQSTIDYSSLTSSRIEEGIYRVNFPSVWSSTYSIYVMATGYESWGPIKANIHTISTSYFEISMSDDASRNNGGFMFTVYGV